jgi:hypothetical protein
MFQYFSQIEKVFEIKLEIKLEIEIEIKLEIEIRNQSCSSNRRDKSCAYEVRIEASSHMFFATPHAQYRILFSILIGCGWR